MKYIIEWLEEKTSAKGSKYFKASLKDETGTVNTDVTIFASFGEVTNGGTVEGVLKPNVYNGKTSYVLDKADAGGAPKGGSPISKMMDKKAEYIKEAQARKEDSIAFFNSLNNAIVFLQAKGEPFEMEDVYRVQKELLAHYENYGSQHDREIPPRKNNLVSLQKTDGVGKRECHRAQGNGSGI